MEDNKERMWQVIADIYEPIMAIKAIHDKNPEFQGYFDWYVFADGSMEIGGTAIKPYKFKIDKNGHWSDCTERKLEINDRGKK